MRRAVYTITPGKAGRRRAGVTVKTHAGDDRAGHAGARRRSAFVCSAVKSGSLGPFPAAEAPGPIQGLLLPSGRVTGRDDSKCR